MKVIIGSTNPVKMAACLQSFNKTNLEIELNSIEVNSFVSHQPIGDNEAIEGAKVRALGAFESNLDTDFGVGMESACVFIESEMYLTSWAAVYCREFKYILGSSGRILLPKKIAKAIIDGGELGPIADKILNQNNSKQDKSIIYFLTRGVYTRKDDLILALDHALAPIFNHEFYPEIKHKVLE